MLQRTVMDDVDQFLIAEHAAFEKYRARHVDLVVRELENEIVRRIGQFRETLRQSVTHGHFDIVDQLVQDVGHEGAFAVREIQIALDIEIADGRGQARMPLHTSVASHL